jgi:hypothetical protein
VPATPLKPSTAAMIAMTKNVIAQDSMYCSFSVALAEGFGRSNLR